MLHSYTFQHNSVVLRPLEEKDIEELRVLRNKNQEFFLNSLQITPEQQKGWFRHYLEKDDDVMFAVELAEKPGEFIGAIAIYNIDRNTGTAECGRTVIDKEKAPIKGIGTEVTASVCHVAFSQMGIRKIVGEILKSNERIMKVDKRAGFVVVGENDACWLIEMTPETIRLS